MLKICFTSKCYSLTSSVAEQIQLVSQGITVYTYYENTLYIHIYIDFSHIYTSICIMYI